jgi:hypothetical protein
MGYLAIAIICLMAFVLAVSEREWTWAVLSGLDVAVWSVIVLCETGAATRSMMSILRRHRCASCLAPTFRVHCSVECARADDEAMRRRGA